MTTTTTGTPHGRRAATRSCSVPIVPHTVTKDDTICSCTISRAGGISYLTCGPWTDTALAWSRDGSLLAFTSDIEGTSNIWMMDMTRRFTGGIRSMTRVSAFVTSAFDPAWTSNGELVFTTFEKFSFRLASLKNVRAIFDTSTTVRTLDLMDCTRPWEAAMLSAHSEVQRLKYRGDYSLDVAQSAISTDPGLRDRRRGVSVALSDVLGNDQAPLPPRQQRHNRRTNCSRASISPSPASPSHSARVSHTGFTGSQADGTISVPGMGRITETASA